MRFFLRLVIQMDYSFLEDVATHFAKGDKNKQRSDEEIVVAALDGTAHEKLTGFALRLVLSDHLAISREGERAPFRKPKPLSRQLNPHPERSRTKAR